MAMKEKMVGRKFIRMSVIDKYIGSSGGDIEGDWITMGVIVSKVPPKTSSKVSFRYCPRLVEYW